MPSIAYIRKRTFEVINATEPGDRLGIAVDYFIITLILTNILALMLETVKPYYNAVPWAFEWFETGSVAVFTLEYMLRIWSSTEDPKFKGRFKYACKPFCIFDVLAIFPYYAPFLGVEASWCRFLRVFRLLRLITLFRYNRAFDEIIDALKRKKDLLVAAYVLVAGIILVLSTVVYFIERKAQPEAFSNAFQGMWWGVATLTTVGYGDIFPITLLGKTVTGFASLLTLGVVALPAGIITLAFLEGQQKHQESLHPEDTIPCPMCGGDGHLDEGDPGLELLKNSNKGQSA